jgi:2,4-diketo-3-deoxy-L-fuconate hydrolase
LKQPGLERGSSGKREEDVMGFRLLSYVGEKGSSRTALLVGDDRAMDIELALRGGDEFIEGLDPTSMLSILGNWDRVLPLIRETAGRMGEAPSSVVGRLSDLRLSAPILYPPNIYCAAANYVEHSKEMRGGTLPDKANARPYFFTKATRQTIVGPGEPIRIPYPEAKVDWEAEIGVVLGRRCRNVAASRAMECVAGFVVFNDLSDRARNFRDDWPFKFDWLGGKSFDTSAPMGPWITPVELVPDPHNLAIELWVNEDLMQSASSRQMYFTIPEQIEYLSELLTLLPGDVIATGTPSGVGHARGLYLKPGDAVTITIEGLGTMRNPVIAGYPPGV